MRSDPSQYSISSISHSHQPFTNQGPRPVYDGLINDSSPLSCQTRRSSLGQLPSTRASFDQANLHQQTAMSKTHYPAMGLSDQTSPPMWTIHSANGAFAGDPSTFPSEGYAPYDSSVALQPISSSDYSTSVSAEDTSCYPSMSPSARQLPQPSGRGLGMKGSVSSNQGQFHSAAGLHPGYPNGHYVMEHVFPQTSHGSVAPISQGAASTLSSSPTGSHSANFGYTPIPPPSPEMVTANLSDYHTAATSIEPVSTLPSTSTADGRRAQLDSHCPVPTLDPYQDYLGSSSNDHRTGVVRNDSSSSEYSSYRMIQPEQGYQPLSRTTTHERR